MRITLAQTHIVWENKKLNIKNAERIIINQAKDGTDIVLFPEMCFTGFSMNTRLTRDRSMETQKTLQSIAVNNHIGIGFGWVEEGEDKCKNIYTILKEDGEIIASYGKIHPFSYSNENKYFMGGKEISIFNLNGIPFSIFICYDLRFPELFRAVANNVHAVIVPANWPGKRSEHWKTLLRARAIENQVYIFAINCVGNIKGVNYSGDSCVINPNGEVIKMLSDKEGVIAYDFEDDTAMYRESFPVLKDIIDLSNICIEVNGQNR